MTLYKSYNFIIRCTIHMISFAYKIEGRHTTKSLSTGQSTPCSIFSIYKDEYFRLAYQVLQSRVFSSTWCF